MFFNGHEVVNGLLCEIVAVMAGLAISLAVAFVKEIHKTIQLLTVKIQTIANLMCMNKCPMVTLHANYNAHASQRDHVMNNFSFDYYLFSCAEKLLSNPVEILRSAFIRPEDLHYYEEAGVDNIKLVERSMTTEALALIVKAYTERSYDGNMMDLIHGLSKYIIYNKDKYYWKGLKYLLQPTKINILKAQKPSAVQYLRTVRNCEWELCW